jgi:hypothetical protein
MSERPTIQQLKERWRALTEALDDLRQADPADVELARREFLAEIETKLSASGAGQDQRAAELRDLKARAAELRRLLGLPPADEAE